MNIVYELLLYGVSFRILKVFFDKQKKNYNKNETFFPFKRRLGKMTGGLVYVVYTVPIICAYYLLNI
jgi:hypothetical protein